MVNGWSGEQWARGTMMCPSTVEVRMESVRHVKNQPPHIRPRVTNVPGDMPH